MACLCLCIGLGNGFWIGHGKGGGGGVAQTSAQLKCVWARNVFGRQRKIKSDIGQSYLVLTTRSMRKGRERWPYCGCIYYRCGGRTHGRLSYVSG